jgi:molybdate transport system substrate-binding protein
MNTLFRTLSTSAIAACLLLPFAPGARASELKVLTTGILKGAFNRIATQFEKETGHKVSMSWGPSSGNSPEASPVRVRNGEPVDVLIMVDTGMDDLVRSGHFEALDRSEVAISKIGVAVKAGRPVPDITTVASFRQALLDAKSIAYSEGASGTYVASVLLKKLGIQDQVASRSHVVLGRRFVAEVVASGEAELGIQQLSELRLEPGVTVVGPLPEELQKASVVSAAVSAKAKDVDAAKRFLAFLSTPFATSAIQQSGLDVPEFKR